MRKNPNPFLSKAIASTPQKGYIHYHRKRFEKLMEIISRYHFAGAKILDIGNSMFSQILADYLDDTVDELGFLPDASMPHGNRYQFDLNLCQNHHTCRSDLAQYDIVVLAEVIEHLYTSPDFVFRFMRTILKDRGVIIIQTPNATVLHKRLQLLMGQNPYMLISKDRRNPGHFREYTKQELSEYAERNGFAVVESFYANYFDYRFDSADANAIKIPLRGLINLFYDVSPAALRPGISMVIRKKDRVTE